MKKTTFKDKLKDLSAEFIKKNLDESKKEKLLDPKLKTSNKEDYLVESFLALSEVETILEQLEQAPYFLSNFRQTKKLKEKSIKRFDHIIYHIESYLYRTTGILDRVLILLNLILETNLPPEKCKAHNFLLNQKGKEGKYAKVVKRRSAELFLELNLLNLLIQNFRDIRNEVTHQKRYSSMDLRNAEMYSIVEADIEIKNFKYFVKEEMDKAVSSYKKKMLNFNKKVREHLDKIYECLDLVWTENYEQK